jgi:hypothetical protein
MGAFLRDGAAMGAAASGRRTQLVPPWAMGPRTGRLGLDEVGAWAILAARSTFSAAFPVGVGEIRADGSGERKLFCGTYDMVARSFRFTLRRRAQPR